MRAFLRDLGIREGMLIYVQSSFGSLGYYPKGAAGFLDLLNELVGPAGTLAMPSFPFGGSMEAFVATNPVFDVAQTPSKVGVLPEVLRQLQGSKRSIHPTHSVIARGGRAAELVEGHERCLTPQGDGSPFQKLVQWGAYILRIGTPAYPVCHHMQEVVRQPNLFLPDPVELCCIDSAGRSVQVQTAVYRRRVPFLLYMDTVAPGEAVAMNIIDFPLLFTGREEDLRRDPSRHAAVDWLVGVRERFVAAGNLSVQKLNGCVCELFPLRPSFEFAVSELPALFERHSRLYEDPDSLLAALESGQVRI